MSGKPIPTAKRLWAKSIIRDDGCVEWIGDRNEGGYGKLRSSIADGPVKTLFAHRAAYELTYGPIPDGLVIDHLCRNPWCVAPAHLEPVTIAENIRRGNAGLFNRNKTHCPQGHEYTPENTYPQKFGRLCLTCKRERGQRNEAKRRAEARRRKVA